MIYIEKINEEYETIYIPRNTEDVGYWITLKNLINNKEYSFELSIPSKHFYSLNIDKMINIEKGLYTYYIKTIDEIVIESGIAQSGVFNNDIVSYNQKKEYKQYKG